mgnify:CR=1 FL=1
MKLECENQFWRKTGFCYSLTYKRCSAKTMVTIEKFMFESTYPESLVSVFLIADESHPSYQKKRTRLRETFFLFVSRNMRGRDWRARGSKNKKLFLANTYERNCPKKKFGWHWTREGDTERRRGMRVEGIPRVIHTIYAAIYNNIYIHVYIYIYIYI